MPVCHTGGRGFESRQPRLKLLKKNEVRVAGAVAQLGERSVRNAEVRGSIPLGSIVMDRARVAELVDAQGSGPCED